MHSSTDIPSVEPTEIIQGSTIKWNKTLSHYSASDGWVLTYAVRGESILDITATASGSDHAIVLSTAQTLALIAGSYYWQSYATKGAERFDVASGLFEVLRGLNALKSGIYDGRSHAKKVLDAIESVLEGRAETADKQVTIGGKTVINWGPAELLVFRDKYKAEYARELNAKRLELGIKSRSRILTRFV